MLAFYFDDPLASYNRKEPCKEVDAGGDVLVCPSDSTFGSTVFPGLFLKTLDAHLVQTLPGSEPLPTASTLLTRAFQTTKRS